MQKLAHLQDGAVFFFGLLMIAVGLLWGFSVPGNPAVWTLLILLLPVAAFLLRPLFNRKPREVRAQEAPEEPPEQEHAHNESADIIPFPALANFEHLPQQEASDEFAESLLALLEHFSREELAHAFCSLDACHEKALRILLLEFDKRASQDALHQPLGDASEYLPIAHLPGPDREEVVRIVCARRPAPVHGNTETALVSVLRDALVDWLPVARAIAFSASTVRHVEGMRQILNKIGRMMSENPELFPNRIYSWLPYKTDEFLTTTATSAQPKDKEQVSKVVNHIWVHRGNGYPWLSEFLRAIGDAFLATQNEEEGKKAAK